MFGVNELVQSRTGPRKGEVQTSHACVLSAPTRLLLLLPGTSKVANLAIHTGRMAECLTTMESAHMQKQTRTLVYHSLYHDGVIAVGW